MPYIRPRWIFILLGFFISGCSSQGSLKSDTENRPAITEGFHLTSTHPLPFDSSFTKAVAKVFIGNSQIGSGAFISDNGLFLTTYEPVFSLVSENQEYRDILNGFSSDVLSSEVPIPGLALLVLIEEWDVTGIYEDQIPERASNSQVARLKQQITQALIREETGATTDVFVQITDTYSGNQQILSVYKILNDIRLVWSDNLGLSNQQLSESNQLLNASSGKTSLLRAYTGPDGISVGFNTANVPYIPSFSFGISDEIPENTPVIALGFPERTFRTETSRALNFYYTITNPSIIDAYVPYQLAQDQNARNDPDYAYSSIYRRYNNASQVARYRQIQELFSAGELFGLKADQESDFQFWLENDTTINPSYHDIFNFINQAFDIAEQNGSSFYATSYAINLGRIDDLANQIKIYYEQSALAQTDQEVLDLKDLAINNIDQLLRTINIEAELGYLSYSLASIHSIPKEQQLPSLDALFKNVEEDQVLETAMKFLERQKSGSFLFDLNATQLALENETVFDDSLFIILDEILFVNDMNRNNHAIYLAYLQPAQQVLIRALMEKEGAENLLPDANGTLRYNKGFFRGQESLQSSDFIYTHNDFSANGPGSAVVTMDGFLLGITDAQNSSDIFSNYMFNKDTARLKSTNITELFRKWEGEFSDKIWFKELSSAN